MAKIPEVNIASFWNLSNDKLPESALSGQIIIVEESKDMYVGTGLTTPILKISDLHVVETVDELKGKDNSLPFLYLIESTNELYFFNKRILTKCNGLGIIGVCNKYENLPFSNPIEGLFCVKNDKMNNMYNTLYLYDKVNGYSRVHYANFDANSFYQFKVNDTYLSAKNANNVLNINTDNSLYTSVSDNKISINQKLYSNNILSREQYDLSSGSLGVFPDGGITIAYMAMVKNEIYVLGYNIVSPASYINKLYKYNRVDGWILLKTDGIPYSNMRRFAIFSHNDKIYICGGITYKNQVYNNLYEFDPETFIFTEKANMNVARCDFHYGVIDNKLWVIGGRSVDGTIPIRSVEYYDFESETWTLLPTEYDSPINFYYGGSFALDREIHLFNIADNAIHYAFNVDTFTYTAKNDAPFNGTCAGMVITKYNVVYCIREGVIYSYNIDDDSWINCGSLLYPKTCQYLCIDENDTIYSLGHYASNGNARTLETIQSFHKDITNDCQVIVRQPLSKKILYDNELSRSLTIPKGGYINYICCGGNETLDIIIEDFKY